MPLIFGALPVVHHFEYRDGLMHAEDVDLTDLAAEVGTPFYCYSSATLRRHMRVMREAFDGIETLLAYAMKANSNQAVLKVLAAEGAGADVVSGGELERAIAAGIPPHKIVFSGVAKTHAEMRRALELDIHCFNIESEPELERLSEVAAAMGATARVSVRINPNVDAMTHAKISTGKSENKFGIPVRARARRLCAHRRAARRDGGRRRHAYRQPDHRARPVLQRLRADGAARRRPPRRAATPSTTSMSAAASASPITATTRRRPIPRPTPRSCASASMPLGCGLIIEPGRLIVGNAGILVTRVEYVKQSNERTFVIVDAAMNDLIRPTLYEAHHDILPVARERRQVDHRRHRRPGLRERRLPRQGPRDHRGGGRRPPRGDDRRRLRRGDGLDLQLAPAGARSAGRRRPLGGDPPPADGRGADRRWTRCRSGWLALLEGRPLLTPSCHAPLPR